MRSNLVRRITAAAGGTAVITMVGLTAACGGTGEQPPQTPSSTTTTTTTTTTTPPSTSETPNPVPPSEKTLDPNGGNLFTPAITASPQNTVLPGRH